MEGEGCRPWDPAAVSRQTITTREHGVPGKKGCSALAPAQPSSAQLPPTPAFPGSTPAGSGDLDEAQPCLRHFAILGLIKTPQTV